MRHLPLNIEGRNKNVFPQTHGKVTSKDFVTRITDYFVQEKLTE